MPSEQCKVSGARKPKLIKALSECHIDSRQALTDNTHMEMSAGMPALEEKCIDDILNIMPAEDLKELARRIGVPDNAHEVTAGLACQSIYGEFSKHVWDVAAASGPQKAVEVWQTDWPAEDAKLCAIIDAAADLPYYNDLADCYELFVAQMTAELGAYYVAPKSSD